MQYLLRVTSNQSATITASAFLISASDNLST